MLRKAKLQIKYVKQIVATKSRDKTLKESIDSITKLQLDLITPKNLNPADTKNYINTLEISFENICTSLEEAGVVNPKQLSVFEFYAKIRYFETRKKSPQQPKRK